MFESHQGLLPFLFLFFIFFRQKRGSGRRAGGRGGRQLPAPSSPPQLQSANCRKARARVRFVLGSMSQYSMMGSRGRPGTRSGRPPTQGVGMGGMGGAGGPAPMSLNTDVKVDYRPVTSQGLSGMATKPLGPGRQIADKSYWLGILRDKVGEITREIGSLRAEETRHARDNAEQVKLERRYESTIKEVRFLEGKLADFNLALDKLRNNTDVTEIKDTHDALRFDNERDRKQIDALFLESNKCAEDTARMEARLQQLHAAAAEELRTLGPQFRADYEALRQRNAELKTSVEGKEEALEILDQKIQRARVELKRDEFKRLERGLDLRRRLEALRSQEAELVEEARENLSPEEMKRRLLAKVKTADAEIARLRERAKEVKKDVTKSEDEADRLRREVDEAKRLKKKYGDKHQQLLERDRTMTSFIEGFGEAKAALQGEMEKLQGAAVAIMAHISKGLEWKGRIEGGGAGRAAAEVGRVREELSFKERQSQLSRGTLTRARADLDKRRKELKNIETLSVKIASELETLGRKRAQMLEEMQGFRSIDELQAHAAREKHALVLAREATKRRADAMREMVQVVSQPLARKAAALKGSNTLRKIADLEKKLAAHEQSVHHLADSIETRKRESQYTTLLHEAMNTVRRINQLIVASPPAQAS